MAIYGAKFTNAWAGVDPDEMKRTWADTLCRFDRRQIEYALGRCEREIVFPPTLPEFVQICREGHYLVAEPPRAIEHKPGPFVPSVSEVELQVRREIPKPKNGVGAWWAKRILRLEELGEKQHFRSIEIAREALGVKPKEAA